MRRNRKIFHCFYYDRYWYIARPWLIIPAVWQTLLNLVERGLYGWAKDDVWSFDGYLADWMPDALEYFAKTAPGFPGILEGNNDEDSMKEWVSIVNKIRDGFRAYRINIRYEHRINERQRLFLRTKFREGMALFIKYFWNLWQ